MASTLHIFTVKGYGPFPIDMLRYDRCWPASEEDAAQAQYPGSDGATVRLVAHESNRHWQPTRARWESFGWKVIETDGVYHA